ncbi:MAG: hypothetical protein BalsKO_14390 [Balneolaceae bacterium]
MLEKLSYGMISKINNPEVIQFIQDHLTQDPSKLVLSVSKYPDLPIKEIAIQIASRKKAKRKLPEWYSNQQVIFPPKENLEQASSELTARFKTRWVEGQSIVDLTGGTGVDLFYLSEKFNSSFYVEPNSELAEITKFNFGLLSRNVTVVNKTAEEFLSSNAQKFDVIYLDPSRRDQSKQRVFGIEDYKPNVITLYNQLLKRGKEVIIKTSPMIDIKSTLKLLPNTCRVQVVAVDNEVKEVLFYLKNKAETQPLIEAWNVSVSKDDEYFSFSFENENKAISEISRPSQFIYEPNSAIRKAGAFNLLGSRFNLKKLHPNTHLYTSDEIVNKFPGRIFKAEKKIKPNKKEIRKAFPLSKVNVISKNFPMSANEIKKRYGLKDGGDAFLIFCDLPSQKIALMCSLVDKH